MSPGEWFAAVTPDPLLAVVWRRDAYEYPTPRRSPGGVAGRRLRMFGCACARQVWDWLTTEARSAVGLSERVARRDAAESELEAAAVNIRFGSLTPEQHAGNAAGWASAGFNNVRPIRADHLFPLWDPAEAARSAAKAIATRAAGPAPPGFPTTAAWEDAWNTAFAAARATQADYLRDIFPPPGYDPRIDPAWLTSTVVGLAGQMDESGDFSAVPILADSLQDAGCDDEAALACCRVPGSVHVRGNWVVDLVLRRE